VDSKSASWSIEYTCVTLKFSCAKLFFAAINSTMARPKGQKLQSRLTVSLDDKTYRSLLDIAQLEGLAVAWLARRAIHELIERHNQSKQSSSSLLRGQLSQQDSK
jgi:hypothetical protein